MTTLRALSFRARSLALHCALFVSLPLRRLARRLRASSHCPRPARARFAYSGFRRFACLLMIALMSAQFVLAPPEVSHAAVKAVAAAAAGSAQEAHHWWHASGWAASSERFLRRIWDGKGAKRRAAPKPKPQETQEQRNGRVARVDISPREATIAAGQVVHFIAVAYDANNSPVGGVQFDWDKVNEDTGERAPAEESGKFSSAIGRFSSAKEGNYRVKARFGGIEASAKVKVKGVRRSSGQQQIGTRTVSSRDLPQQSRSSLSPPATKDRIAKKTSGRFATRYSSAGTMAMPRLLPLLPDENGWNDGNHWSADDPGMERGAPLGRKPDGGAGSGNFHFAAPVLSYEGRGLDLNVGMAYNSRIWHKVNSDITCDIDRDWPALGWSLGFGKIVGMGLQSGYMLIDPDGTRHSYDGTLTVEQLYQRFKGHTTDGTFIDLDVTGFNAANGGAPETGFAYFPNGTLILYGAPGSNAIYPVYIEDANGNMIWISYRNNQGPHIATVTDPLGRVSQFHYDSNNLLTAITAPGFDGSTRTAVRLHYRDLTLDAGNNYGFTGLTTHVRQSTVPVIDAIYYPATGTGYWFGDGVGDGGSYSSYGMLNKIIEQRGMSFIDQGLTSQGVVNQGSMTRQMVYDYPMTSIGLTDTPTYETMTETWAGMTVPAAETQYDVHENDSPRRVVITRPDGVRTVMLSHNTPGQFTDGLVYQEETYTPAPQDVLLGKSFVQWEEGDYDSPRPSRVETTDERGQTTGKELSYGPRFNQVTEIREYDYGYSHGGANTLLRKTVNQYLNNSNYTDPLSGGAYWRHIFNLLTLNEVYAGDGVTRLARTVYSYDEFTGAAGLQNTPDIVYSGHDLAFDPYVPGAYNPITEYRGNVTTIKRYADAETLDEETAVVEIRRYDITGNVRKVETSCCEQTTINYTVNTQYAWPESQISGSPTDVNKQNTTSATYDFNTGLVETSTDANGRDLQTTYDLSTLRPVEDEFSTGGYTSHIYDNVAMTVKDYVYEVGQEDPDYASRVDKYLDGKGRVIKKISFGKAGAQDIVEMKYDQLGRLSQQSRPYRAGETPLWNTVTYDFLDRPEQTTAPDNQSVVTRSYNQPDPPGSSGQPGETIKVTDPWGRQRWARSDALGRMVEVAEPDPGGSGTLSSGALFTTYTYDELDRLVQVNQGEQTRSFRYDSFGRMTHQKLAERGATLDDDGVWVEAGQWSDFFTYDKRSNLTLHVDARGVKTTFKYKDTAGVEDPLNRLLEVEYDKGGSPPHLRDNIPVTPKVNYAYMTTGDKKRVQNVTVDQGVGNETMSYDSEGRLSRVSQTFPGRVSYPIVTDYLWDSLDRLEDSTYPQQYGAGEIRKKVEPAYDAASRMDSLKFGGVTMASNPVYNAASQTTSLDVGSQIVEKYDFDPKTGLLFGQQVNKGAEKLVDLQYRYTLDVDWNNNGAKTGQLTYVRDVKNEARNRNYVYDKLGRLKQVRGGTLAYGSPTWHQTYSYDRYGNRSLVQHTELAASLVNPGSQSRSDLIGKVGQGAGGAANPIFSAAEPFAALGIDESYSSTAANSSDSDGTPVRGGPRVYEEEYSKAPSANAAGRELPAKHPAGDAPSAPRKEFGYRGGRSPAAAQASIITVYPGAYQTPDATYGGSLAVNSPSNTGHGSTTAYSFQGYPAIYDTPKTCRWTNFQSISGQILGITLKFDWTENNVLNGYYASYLFGVQYSIDGGSSWITSFEHSCYAPYGCVSYPNSGSTQITLPAIQNISQVQVRAVLAADGGDYGGASSVTGSISNIRLEVATDITPPVISNVAAQGINLYGATINWTTNENSDSQVEYGTTASYGQSTILNPSGVTAHSQGLSGLKPGTVYHYRVKSKDANGNLAISTDRTFTTDPLVISNVAAGAIAASCVTITWNTNVPTNSQVEYRTNTGSWQPTPINPALVTAHSQVLTGLTAHTVYHYRVRSRDAANNLVESGEYTFTTGTLVVSSVNVVNITTTSATITWNTNEPTTTQVEYGLTPAYGQFAPLTPSATLATAHSVVLTGLTPGKVYHFRANSIDAAGNHAYCSGLTFTTAQSVPTDGLANLSYNTANNQITTAGFEYDPAGNQTRAVINASGTQQQYRYDCAGRLAQVLDGSGNVLATYSYGAGNQRLMSVEGGVTKYFAWAGGKIIAEYEAWGANALIWKTSYVYLGGRLLATTSGAGGNETRFHHPDRLGGTRLTTAPDGTVVTEQLSMPFGTMLPFTSTYGGEKSYQHPTLSNPSKKRFTTYDRSDVTGVDYAVNRHYSSAQGRFTQVDPIEMDAASLSNPQTLNLYAYCGNDPINRSDPEGMFFGFLKNLFKWVLRIAAVVLAVVTVVVAVPLIGIMYTGGQVAGMLLGAAALGVAGWTDSKIGTFISMGLLAGAGFLLGVGIQGIIKNLAETGGKKSMAAKLLLGVYAYSTIDSFLAKKKQERVEIEGNNTTGFRTAQEAAVSALRRINARSIRRNREYAGSVCRRASDGRFIYTGPNPGTSSSSVPPNCPSGTTKVGDYHTHAAYDPSLDLRSTGDLDYNEVFSYDDIHDPTYGNDTLGIQGWLATPTRRIYRYDPTGTLAGRQTDISSIYGRTH